MSDVGFCMSRGREASGDEVPSHRQRADSGEELARALAKVVHTWSNSCSPSAAQTLAAAAVEASMENPVLEPFLEAVPYWRNQRRLDSAANLALGLGRGAADPCQRRLDDLERDADFWCQLMQGSGDVDEAERQGRLGADADLSDVRETLLENFFDLSPERVMEIFNSLVRTDEGGVCAEALGEGLVACGISGFSSDMPERILKAVACSCHGRLQPAEFEAILSRLKLAQLLVGAAGRPDFTQTARSLSVVDYSPRNPVVVSSCCGSAASLREFFFGHRPAPRQAEPRGVRWVHLAGLDMTLLLALTVKYSLHPLGVEDVIEQCRTKVERYGSHFFAAVEQLCLAPGGSRRRGGHEPVKVAGSHVAIFCSGPPTLDTMVTVSQPDRSFPDDWPGADAQSPGGGLPASSSEEWVVRLRRRIEKPLSRLRERQAHFLMLQVLDICSDDLVELMHAYVQRVCFLEGELRKKGAAVRGCWLEEMSLIRLQLGVVQRRARGLLRACRQLNAPDVRQDFAGYIEDITDHLDETFDDASLLVDKCSAVIGAYERAAERLCDHFQQVAQARSNDTLFVLTVITTVLMPLQLVAGIYGMNFTHMPELESTHGYQLFWVGSGIYLVVAAIVASSLHRRLRKTAASEQEVLDDLPDPYRAMTQGTMPAVRPPQRPRLDDLV